MDQPSATLSPGVSLSCTVRVRIVFDRSGFASAQNNIEAIAERLERNGRVPIELGDQAVACSFVRGAVENRIERYQRIAGKKHLRDQPRSEGRPEDRHVNMRRAPCILGVRPWILARPNRYETIAAFRIGQGMSASGKVGVEGCIVLIVAVKIAAGGVRLPD